MKNEHPTPESNEVYEEIKTAEKHVSIEEICNNLSARNSTGRNIFGRGIRGDIEEYLGWHLDNIKESPLSQLDRVDALEKIKNTEFLLAPEMAESDLKKFLDTKITELCREEAQKYLSTRKENLLFDESPDVVELCEQIGLLREEHDKKAPGTLKWPRSEPRTGRAAEVDELFHQINELETNLGKLLFQQQRNKNLS